MYIYNSPQCAETANIDEIALENWVLYYLWILKYAHAHTKVTGHGYRSHATEYSPYSFLC